MRPSYASPRITYVDDVDDEAPTLPKKALSAERAQQVLNAVSKRTKTLAPVTADATLERFIASPIADDSDELSANVRLNWIWAPGSDLFIVVDTRRGRWGEPNGPIDQVIAIKFTRLLRF